MSGRATTLDASSELLNELRALIASGGTMGPFDERRVRQVTDAMREAYQHRDSILSNPYADPQQPYYAGSLAYYRAKYLRDKRCLLTYLLWRLERSTDAWWSAVDNTLQPVLSTAETEYLSGYNTAMVEYMTSFAIDVDLRAFTWRPPTQQQLEVRGLVHHVFVSPLTGATIALYPGKQVLLAFEEAESLLQQKVVELVV